GLVRLAEEPVGGEDQEDVGGLLFQDGSEPIQARPTVLGAADGRVEADEVAGDEDPLSDRELEELADLVADRILVTRAIARVDGAEGLSLLGGQARVELGGEPIDLAIVLVVEPVAFGLGSRARKTGVGAVHHEALSRAGTSVWGPSVGGGPRTGYPAGLESV